ncbi:PAS domain-containing sensor histidine kinase [Treponema sp.]
MDTSLTHFAPAERDSLELIQEDSRRIAASSLFDMILNAIPDCVLLLNERRQVIFANQAAVQMLGSEASDILGGRPGELVSCVHSQETVGGCGTSEACRYCGAVNAILLAQNTDQVVDKDCRISVDHAGKIRALDLHVTAKKLHLEDKSFILITLADISDLNRRRILERVFFHDVINSISALQSGAFLLKEDYGKVGTEYLEPMLAAVEYLLEEVLKQRDFLAMERGDLAVEFETLSSKTFLQEIVTLCSLAEIARDKVIVFVDALSEAQEFQSDPVLLRRVIVNMIKNAIEASAPGDSIHTWTKRMNGCIRFSVQNPVVMTDEVKAQIFQRSFSTKGSGRGIGTYSMRMLSQNYLKGSISFSSATGEGTTFWVDIPLSI